MHAVMHKTQTCYCSMNQQQSTKLTEYRQMHNFASFFPSEQGLATWPLDFSSLLVLTCASFWDTPKLFMSPLTPTIKSLLAVFSAQFRLLQSL